MALLGATVTVKDVQEVAVFRSDRLYRRSEVCLNIGDRGFDVEVVMPADVALEIAERLINVAKGIMAPASLGAETGAGRQLNALLQSYHGKTKGAR